MYSEDKELAKIYGTAKTQKFDSTDNIELTKLKFAKLRPIVIKQPKKFNDI